MHKKQTGPRFSPSFSSKSSSIPNTMTTTNTNPSPPHHRTIAEITPSDSVFNVFDRQQGRCLRYEPISDAPSLDSSAARKFWHLLGNAIVACDEEGSVGWHWMDFQGLWDPNNDSEDNETPTILPRNPFPTGIVLVILGITEPTRAFGEAVQQAFFDEASRPHDGPLLVHIQPDAGWHGAFAPRVPKEKVERETGKPYEVEELSTIVVDASELWGGQR